MSEPVKHICPNCQAKPGEPCTQPTDKGRTPIKWFHDAREIAAIKEPEKKILESPMVYIENCHFITASSMTPSICQPHGGAMRFKGDPSICVEYARVAMPERVAEFENPQFENPQPQPLYALKPGDEAYIINGAGNRAKRVEVVFRVRDSIRVLHTDERGNFHYDFDAITGEAVRSDGAEFPEGHIPKLVTEGNPRLAVILQRAKHRQYREQLMKHADAFRDEPTLANLQALQAFVTEWGYHSTGLDLITNIAALAGEPQ